MNEKKAKKLRHKARGLSVGQPNVEYMTDGNGSTVLTPTCTKGVYRRLKKEYFEQKRKPL